MKKFFTLIALLAVVLGAKADWEKVYSVDYSSFNGFPYYVMGFVPEWYDGVMTDKGGNYAYTEVEKAEESGVSVFTNNNGAEYIRTEKENDTWHQYFFADGIPTELDGAYTLKAMVRATEACTVPVQMRWSWNEDPVASELQIGTEWEMVECEFSGIGGTSCSLIAQPNTAAQIEWKTIEVWQNKKASRPVEWLEQLTNGDAEAAWADPNVKFNDTENNYKICAWSKQKGTNVNADGGSDPFPAEIVALPEGGHAFIVRGAVADTEGDAAAWDNQFWIQSPKSWKEGTQVKLHFRYKASQNCKTNTQIHKQNPSDYLHWQAVGDVDFTTEWQELDKTFTFDASMSTGWSIAFNLNPDVKDAVDFYFDDLSWQIMKLDTGLVVASANTVTGIAYDFDAAVKFENDEDAGAMVAIVGEKGKQNTWVNEIMISTISGADQAFRSATIKPAYVKNDAEDWCGYTDATNYKIKLPAAGVWQISIIEDGNYINFVKLEGEEDKEPLEIVANPTEVIVNAVERDWLVAKEDGSAQEDEIGAGQPWDNQFMIMANRNLEAGETVVIEFDYWADAAAKTNTQCGGTEPGAYVHWSAIGDVDFTAEKQHFEKTFKIAGECASNMASLTFNMAVMKGANNYHIANVKWYTEDMSETLIDMEGTKNFFVKTGAGTAPYQFGTDPSAVMNVVAKDAAASAIYNLAGQAVSNNYKGIVVSNGKKFIRK